MTQGSEVTGTLATVDNRVLATARQRMTAAREGMLQAFPFWGALALRLRVVCDPSCRTAWVDGTSIGYSPAYIAGCTFDEVVFIWAHEVAHCAFGHPWRRDGRLFYWFNVSCDLAINSILKAHGFILPEGVLIDDEKWAGRSSEWIYARLTKGPDPDEPPPPPPPPGDDENEDEGEDDDEGGDAQDDEGEEGGNGSPGDDESDEDGQDDGQDGQDGEDGDDAQDDGQDGAQGERPAPCGEVRDAPQGPTAECQEPMTEDDWKQAVESAILTASRMGKVGGLLKRTVGDLRKAKADWPTLLRCFFTEAARSDYSFRRPNRRYAGADFILPSLCANGMGPVVIGIDTSGSVDDIQRAQMQAECRAIIADTEPVRTTVIYCDTRVCGEPVTFERGQPIVLEDRGGGGTDFRPVFAHIATMPERPACVVYLTDLCGVFPDQAPDYPVLWANTGSRDLRVPFGEVVRVSG